jgi:hypothetical protein
MSKVEFYPEWPSPTLDGCTCFPEENAAPKRDDCKVWCAYEDDGECDSYEHGSCPEGTDIADCEAEEAEKLRRKSCGDGDTCQPGKFCNYDGDEQGVDGFCEPCRDCGSPDDDWVGCGDCGLPAAGAADCSARCHVFPNVNQGGGGGGVGGMEGGRGNTGDVNEDEEEEEEEEEEQEEEVEEEEEEGEALEDGGREIRMRSARRRKLEEAEAAPAHGKSQPGGDA